MEDGRNQDEGNPRALSVSEAAQIFELYMSRLKQRDPDYQANTMLMKAAEYSNRFASNKNKETMEKMRSLLAEAGLSDEEVALVASLAPTTVDEARQLIPSLERAELTEEDLEQLLQEVATYREFE